MTTPKDRIEQTARDLGLSLTFEFIPWSQSRNRGQPERSLNWHVVVRHAGTHVVLATQYSAGIGHCPSFKWSDASSWRAERVAQECETGRMDTGAKIEPATAAVLYSLVSDSEALDYPSFEAWADALGCDDDSREAERVYCACLDVGLRLRSAIGDVGLTRLREACADY